MKQAAEMACKGVRSTAYGRCSAETGLPSPALLRKTGKILRERF